LELIDLVNLNLKYARADKASVFLEQKGSAVRITVKDNGIGFNPDQVKRNVSREGGLGLFSIEERINDLGGAIVIDSRAHHGTTIVLSFPGSETREEETT
jgi:signal transduction histidine kinase